MQAKRRGPTRIYQEFTILAGRPAGIESILLCGLCGNSGSIHSRATFDGHDVSVVACCICPNGRDLKRRRGLPTWGDTSVLTTKADGGIFREGKP